MIYVRLARNFLKKSQNEKKKILKKLYHRRFKISFIEIIDLRSWHE